MSTQKLLRDLARPIVGRDEDAAALQPRARPVPAHSGLFVGRGG
jgi:hypothetical protein